MKLFKNFIIPFILAIILFIPRPVSAAIELSELTTLESQLYNSLINSYSASFTEASYDCMFYKGSNGSRALVVFPTGYTVNSTNIYWDRYVNIFWAVDNWGSISLRSQNANYTSLWSSDMDTRKFYYDIFKTVPVFDYDSPTPLDIDVAGFTEWLSENPEFKDFIVNNAPWLDLSNDGNLGFLIDYYNAYGMYFDSFMLNHKHWEPIMIPDSQLPTSQQYDILRNMLKQQYNKYVLATQNTPVQQPSSPVYVDWNTPFIYPTNVPSDTITIENNNDSNYYYLREIIRLITVDINNDISHHFDDTNLLNNFVSVINDISFNLNGYLFPIMTEINDKLSGFLVPIVNIGDKLNDISLKLDSGGSGNCNYDESFWEYMLTPTYSGFDDLQQIFVDKFPVLDQITQVPDPDQILIGTSQTISLADSSSDSSAGSSETFSFTAPATFANGAFSNIEIPIIDFSRFSLAISAFKGIISVFALSIFSKWLIKFAPKLLNGYSSSD